MSAHVVGYWSPVGSRTIGGLVARSCTAPPVLGAVDEAVEYTVTVLLGSADRELPSIQAWLKATGAPARARRAVAPSEPGHLGVASDALMVALAPGGVAIAVVGAIVAWLRARRTDVTLRITTKEGRTAEVTARGLRDMDADKVARLVTETVAALEPRRGELGPAVE